MLKEPLDNQIRISEELYRKLEDIRYKYRCRTFNAALVKLFEENETLDFVNKEFKKMEESQIKIIEALLKLSGVTLEDLKNEN